MALICGVTPSEPHLNEMRSTLKFATRAKGLKRKARGNQVFNDGVITNGSKRKHASDKVEPGMTIGALQQKLIVHQVECEKAVMEKDSEISKLQYELALKDKEKDARGAAKFKRDIGSTKKEGQVRRAQCFKYRGPTWFIPSTAKGRCGPTIVCKSNPGDQGEMDRSIINCFNNDSPISDIEITRGARSIGSEASC